jgi:phosphoglycolate phosphatase
MKIILFDIDGTLLKSKPKEIDYWGMSIKKNFNLDIKENDIYREGMIDMEIMCKLLELHGIKNPEKHPLFEKAMNDLGDFFNQAIKNKKIDIKIIPGVHELIKLLLKNNIEIGILTGNIPNKAKAKLDYVGLWDYFNIKAFGDKTTDRSKLVDLAIKDAKTKGLELNKNDIIIIGDTLKDIKSAKKAGVKCIAMATGNEDITILEKENPDYIFENYNNPEKILKVIQDA